MWDSRGLIRLMDANSTPHLITCALGDVRFWTCSRFANEASPVSS
jgi:hypothetical protein